MSEINNYKKAFMITLKNKGDYTYLQSIFKTLMRIDKIENLKNKNINDFIKH